MALTWDMTNVADYEALKTDDEWPITECLIFSTMYLGMGEITEANADEFALRLKMWQTSFGALANEATEDGLKPHFITAADVQRRIGLYTNATTLTKAQFHKNLIHHLRGDAERELAYGKAEKAAQALSSS